MKQLEFQVSISWLNLDGYHVNELRVKVNPKFEVNGDLVLSTGLHTQRTEPIKTTTFRNDVGFAVARHESDAHKFRCDLRVQTKSSEAEVQPPYDYLIDISGYFTVHETIDIKEEKAYIATLKSAVGALYGVCREIILSTTSHGPLPGVILPALTFEFTASGTSPKGEGRKKNKRLAGKSTAKPKERLSKSRSKQL